MDVISYKRQIISISLFSHQSDSLDTSTCMMGTVFFFFHFQKEHVSGCFWQETRLFHCRYSWVFSRELSDVIDSLPQGEYGLFIHFSSPQIWVKHGTWLLRLEQHLEKDKQPSLPSSLSICQSTCLAFFFWLKKRAKLLWPWRYCQRNPLLGN